MSTHCVATISNCNASTSRQSDEAMTVQQSIYPNIASSQSFNVQQEEMKIGSSSADENQLMASTTMTLKE